MKILQIILSQCESRNNKTMNEICNDIFFLINEVNGSPYEEICL